jgi:hypothetical protein
MDCLYRARAFESLATPEALERTAVTHELGRVALGLA